MSFHLNKTRQHYLSESSFRLASKVLGDSQPVTEWPGEMVDEAASDPESLPETVSVFGDLAWRPELRGSPSPEGGLTEQEEQEVLPSKADGHIETAKAELHSRVI